jgi:hypothetical protein
MDDKMRDKVKKEAGLAIDKAAKESRGREIPVESVEVSVKVRGPAGKETSTTVVVEPDRPKK